MCWTLVIAGMCQKLLVLLCTALNHVSAKQCLLYTISNFDLHGTAYLVHGLCLLTILGMFLHTSEISACMAETDK